MSSVDNQLDDEDASAIGWQARRAWDGRYSCKINFFACLFEYRCDQRGGRALPLTSYSDDRMDNCKKMFVAVIMQDGDKLLSSSVRSQCPSFVDQILPDPRLSRPRSLPRTNDVKTVRRLTFPNPKMRIFCSSSKIFIQIIS